MILISQDQILNTTFLRLAVARAGLLGSSAWLSRYIFFKGSMHFSVRALVVFVLVTQAFGLLSVARVRNVHLRPSVLRMSGQCEGSGLARRLASAALIACLGSPLGVNAENIDKKTPNPYEVIIQNMRMFGHKTLSVFNWLSFPRPKRLVC